MPRAFLVLALLDTALLLAAMLLGALGTGVGVASWGALHVRVGLVAVIVTPAVHCLAYAYFLGTGRWIEQATITRGAPAWAADLADRNLRRVVPFLVVSTLLVGAAAWVGLAAREGTLSGLIHLAAATIALAFTLGTFALSYVAIAQQSRLIDDLDTRQTPPAPYTPSPE